MCSVWSCLLFVCCCPDGVGWAKPRADLARHRAGLAQGVQIHPYIYPAMCHCICRCKLTCQTRCAIGSNIWLKGCVHLWVQQHSEYRVWPKKEKNKTNKNKTRANKKKQTRKPKSRKNKKITEESNKINKKNNKKLRKMQFVFCFLFFSCCLFVFLVTLPVEFFLVDYAFDCVFVFSINFLCSTRKHKWS